VTTQPQAFPAIFFAGLACGILDITAAFVTWYPRGVTPKRVLQGVASGWLGRESFQGGWKTAALGLFFHFVVAFSAATVFYIASRKLRFLTRRPVLSGVAYGVAVYLVMYWVVMPLSNYRKGPFSIFNTVVAILTHMVCVGLPIALVVSRFSSRNVFPR
jgi:uncharacterized membrane protein YagU involved in acid resistance